MKRRMEGLGEEEEEERREGTELRKRRGEEKWVVGREERKLTHYFNSSFLFCRMVEKISQTLALPFHSHE